MKSLSPQEVILNDDSPTPARIIDGVVQILGESISKEDINMKFLKSLPSEWKTHTLIWRNKADLEEKDGSQVADGHAYYESQKVSLKDWKESRRGHFARECKSPKENRNKDTPRRNVPVEASTSNALVSQCSSSSSGFDNETSSINLSKLLESQITDKTGLGYDNHVCNSQVFDCDELNSSKSDDSVPTSLVNDRYKSGEGYHAVPPPYTGTFMPPKPDLVFHDAPPAKVLDLSKIANPLYSLRDKDLFKSKDPQVNMRIEQYFLLTDYSLWEVILNGDSPTPARIVDGVVQVISPTTIERKLAKKNELKARETLLMAFTDKHQLKFNIYKDAKSLMEAIEKRFGGNKETKKVWKTLFKQHLPSEWKTHTLIWRNKADLEEQNDEDLKQIDAVDLEEMDLKWQMAMLTMRARRRGHFARECRSQKENRNKDTPRRNVPVEASTSNALVSQCDGVGYDNHVFNSQVFDCDELNSSKSDDSVPTSPVNDRYKSGEGYHAVPPPYTGTFMPPKPNLVFHDAPPASETVLMWHVVPTAVLTRSRLVPLNAARLVTIAVLKSIVKSLRPVTHVVNKAHTPIRRNINHIPVPKNSNFNQTVTTIKVKKVNAVKGANGNWVWKPKCTVLDHVSRLKSASMTLKQFDYTDALGRSNGCSRHMTGNISYLLNFKEINRGYVAFGGNPKGGKITGKDTECVVLSFDFKLPDENHVLLRVPRENNMYDVDLKNVVPSGDLTCLFAKATLDKSNLWHRRLGHINFKIMNKLVKGNLVRGLPSKVFENNHTCVACKKGK
nr:hypothetical protein [Tanacetum cinerariifolium]